MITLIDKLIENVTGSTLHFYAFHGATYEKRDCVINRAVNLFKFWNISMARYRRLCACFFGRRNDRLEGTQIVASIIHNYE